MTYIINEKLCKIPVEFHDLDDIFVWRRYIHIVAAIILFWLLRTLDLGSLTLQYQLFVFMNNLWISRNKKNIT